MVLHAKETKREEVNIECGVRERDFQSVTEDSPEKKLFLFRIRQNGNVSLLREAKNEMKDKKTKKKYV